MDCLLNAINNNENCNGTLALALSTQELTIAQGDLVYVDFFSSLIRFHCSHLLWVWVCIFLTSSCERKLSAAALDASPFAFVHLAAPQAFSHNILACISPARCSQPVTG